MPVKYFLGKMGICRPPHGVKSHAVYLSQYQLIPYNRISEYFRDQAGIDVGTGSVFNFNKEAFGQLEPFEK